MKITIIKPIGYCFGVTEALKIAKRAKLEHPTKEVTIIGMLVHNEQVIKQLEESGIKTLYEKGKSYLELLQEVEDHSVVVFSAHGHDVQMDDVARKKSLIVYDAICPKVKMNLELVLKELANKKKIIYIGQKEHPETIGVLSLSKEIILYDDNLLNNNQISTNQSILVINQTTLNYLNLQETFEKIKAKFPNSTILGEVCSASRLRQQAIERIAPDVDALLVVGSKKSSNTNKLIEIANQAHPTLETHLVLTLEDVKALPLKNKKHIAVASGASTPLETIDVISKYLNNLSK
ncbi:MAG: 4-hydroxy-3-methylbut-2-enyl diphosphate reductase [Erysipelotrichia bacterium]|nr:4-hydroxy-3-methylbut-2-enyl diphosphate reductase [Erysipelotrichia bacterium]